MKSITDIFNNIDFQNPCNVKEYTQEQNEIVSEFVATIYDIFPEYSGRIRDEEIFKDICLKWADDILKINDYRNTLEKLLKVVSVPNFKGLAGKYHSPESTMLLVCRSHEYLIHDYWLICPPQSNSDEIKRIDASLAEPRDKELGPKTIKELLSKL